MSITRSSIPVCMTPARRRCVSVVCHRHSFQPHIVPHPASPFSQQVLLPRALLSPAGRPASGSRSEGWPRLGHARRQLLGRLLSSPFPIFLLSFIFISLCFALLASSCPSPSQPPLALGAFQHQVASAPTPAQVPRRSTGIQRSPPPSQRRSITTSNTGSRHPGLTWEGFNNSAVFPSCILACVCAPGETTTGEKSSWGCRWGCFPSCCVQPLLLLLALQHPPGSGGREEQNLSSAARMLFCKPATSQGLKSTSW